MLPKKILSIGSGVLLACSCAAQGQMLDDFESYADSAALLQVYREFDNVSNPLPDQVELVDGGEGKSMKFTCSSRDYAILFRTIAQDPARMQSALRFRVRATDYESGGILSVYLRRELGSADVVTESIPLTPEWQTVTVGAPELADWREFILLFGCRKPSGAVMGVEVDDFELVPGVAAAEAERTRLCLLDDYGRYADPGALEQVYFAPEKLRKIVAAPTTSRNRAVLRLSSGDEGMSSVLMRECVNPVGAEAFGIEIDAANLSAEAESGLLYVSVRATPEGPDLGRIKIASLPRKLETFRMLLPELGSMDKFYLVYRTERRDAEEYEEMKFLQSFYGNEGVTPFSTTIGHPVTAAVANPRVLLRERAVNVIPQVRSLAVGDGVFQLTPRTAIVAEGADACRAAAELRELLAPATGFTLPVLPAAKAELYPQQIVLAQTPEDAEIGPEGYRLKVDENSIRITAATPAGFFYAMQTLRQLFDAAIESREFRSLEWRIPTLAIADWPEYGWRGMHLDTARHFFPKEYIYRFLDLLAMHKLNVFHWHFNDGTAWRVESEAFPALTAEGAWWGDVGGFYTREDVKEILAYAKARHITVIPELEMPAHANAALNAYPEIACQREILRKGEHGLRNTASWHIRPQWVTTYCASNEKTYEFIDALLRDMGALFPEAPVIHVGGDELPEGAWSECVSCNAFMKEKGFRNEAELQQYFTSRVEAIAADQGRRVMGWEQIVGGELRPDTVVLAYLDQGAVTRAAAAGHDVVSGNASCNYFDYRQGEAADEPVAIVGGAIPLRKSYTFDPMDGVPERLRGKVLGGQGALWTEYIASPAQANYMLFPRLTALSETVWSPRKVRSWPTFERRLNRFYPRLEALGVFARDYRR